MKLDFSPPTRPRCQRGAGCAVAKSPREPPRRRYDVERFRRCAKPNAERATPSSANDDGSGVVTAVSEN